MTEKGVDIIFYLSWIYLSAIVIFEIFIVDIPLVLAKGSNDVEAKENKAIIYYVNRENSLLYKILPIFCILQVIAIVANLIIYYAPFKFSAIAIIVSAFILMIYQTKYNINVVTEMKNSEHGSLQTAAKNLASIFNAHMVTILMLVSILLCYVFKF